jgi:hypothetical protein
MRTFGRIVGLAAVAVVLLEAPAPSLAVVGGTAEQRRMVSWAVDRFASVGLTLPALEIRFHATRDGCAGRLGLYDDGVVDVCRHLTDLWAARELMHELAHGWLDANMTEAARERFLQLRGLTVWSDHDVDWEQRGTEHGAEILAWAIGDQAGGIYTPSIPDNDHERLVVAYRALTGNELPTLRPWELWKQPER